MDGTIIRRKAAGLRVEIPDADPRPIHQAQTFGGLGANGIGLIVCYGHPPLPLSIPRIPPSQIEPLSDQVMVFAEDDPITGVATKLR